MGLFVYTKCSYNNISFPVLYFHFICNVDKKMIMIFKTQWAKKQNILGDVFLLLDIKQSV